MIHCNPKSTAGNILVSLSKLLSAYRSLTRQLTVLSNDPAKASFMFCRVADTRENAFS